MDEAIKAALAETTKLLEDLEWSSRNYYSGNRECPACEADAPNGYCKSRGIHASECGLKKALDRNRELLGQSG